MRLDHDPSFQSRLSQLYRYLAAQNSLFVAESDLRRDGVIMASESTKAVFRQVAQLAMDGTPSIVLLGPSGTGKERLAQAFHRRGPFVTINCAMLRADRLVADLFGAERGAFTGADRPMVGAVERADGGTLFLDEVAELPLEVQAMLLRFLESGEYQRMGAVGVNRRADVRVVAATNRDLRTMATAGTFRVDLFYRLALVVVDVPALRERFDDAQAYLATQMLGSCSALEALQPPALEELRQHTWEGNFRELVNFARRLPRGAARDSIDAATVRRLLMAGALSRPPVTTRPASEPPDGAGDWLQWLKASAAAFCAGSGVSRPRTWADVTVFVEQYLKPWALAHLAAVQTATRVEDVNIQKIAEHVAADRGTVNKQLRRYFETIRGTGNSSDA